MSYANFSKQFFQWSLNTTHPVVGAILKFTVAYFTGIICNPFVVQGCPSMPIQAFFGGAAASLLLTLFS